MELTYCYFHVLLVITFGVGRLSGGGGGGIKPQG